MEVIYNKNNRKHDDDDDNDSDGDDDSDQRKNSYKRNFAAYRTNKEISYTAFHVSVCARECEWMFKINIPAEELLCRQSQLVSNLKK